jgi:hypothetical protein
MNALVVGKFRFRVSGSKGLPAVFCLRGVSAVVTGLFLGAYTQPRN